MAREIKYWVFHQEHLDQALAAYIRAREAEGVAADAARIEAKTVERFLDSQPGALLRGGRAG